VQAQTKGVEGHYEATLKFPQAGTWRWGIEAGLMPDQQPMPDLVVLDTTSVKNVNAQTPLSDKKATLSADRGASSSVPLGVGVIGAVGAIGALLFWVRTRTSLALTLLTVTTVTSTVGFGLAANPATLAKFGEESEQSEASPTQVAPTASAELGQALFVAKGCIVCHRHEAVSDVRMRFQDFADFSVGPDLPTLATDPQLLHKWLKDPSAVKPQTQMPNLKLNETEIDALVAFLLNPTPNAEEASFSRSNFRGVRHPQMPNGAASEA
jgi:cytochrome c2